MLGSLQCRDSKKCKLNHFWDWKSCQCEAKDQCDLTCPSEEALHPDFECKCVTKEVIEILLEIRRKENTLYKPEQCQERRSSEPLIYKWDDKKCMLMARKDCFQICSNDQTLHPEKCQCVNQNEIDNWLYNYNTYWDLLEENILQPHPLLSSAKESKPKIKKTKQKRFNRKQRIFGFVTFGFNDVLDDDESNFFPAGIPKFGRHLQSHFNKTFEITKESKQQSNLAIAVSDSLIIGSITLANLL